MDWISSEVLYYGGLILAITSLAAAAIAFVVFKIGGRRLRKKLDAEYGAKKRPRDSDGALPPARASR